MSFYDNIWPVKPDGIRSVWPLEPLVGVGPLRFGMSIDEVGRVLDPAVGQPWYPLRTAPVQGVSVDFDAMAITTYHDEQHRLCAVAADALDGPQITWDGQDFTGQPPSVIFRWLNDRVDAEDLGVLYSSHADPSSATLGLVIRVQRAGDRVLTRPVAVCADWAPEAGDRESGTIPSEEWAIF